MAKQVFYDPDQARWKRIRRVFDSAALALTLLVAFFIYTVLRSEPLPDLSLRAEKRPYHALKENEKEKAREKRRLATLVRAGRHRRTRKSPSQIKLNAEEGVRAAFYVNWDAASFSSLREYARQIDLLFPVWLQVLTPDGRLQGVDPETNKMFDLVHGASIHSVDDKVMPFLKTEGTASMSSRLSRTSTALILFPELPIFSTIRAVPASPGGRLVPVLRPLQGIDGGLRIFPQKGQPVTLRSCGNCLRTCTHTG
jgi:hypothetical protein